MLSVNVRTLFSEFSWVNTEDELITFYCMRLVISVPSTIDWPPLEY